MRRGSEGRVRRHTAAREDALPTAELSVSLPSRGFYERRGYRILAARFIDVGEGEQLDYWAAEKVLDD